MPNGGLMQLVAYGAQDVYLTANPQVTFFKQLYRRHSNFAVESIEQSFNGAPNFGKSVTCTISRNGDLLTSVYLRAVLPSLSAAELDALGFFAWIPFVGQFLIETVDVEIGGQVIDTHYGEWLHIWNELTLNGGKGRDYLHMVNSYGGVLMDVNGTVGDCDSCGPSRTLPTVMEAANSAIAGLNGSGTDGSLGVGLTLKGAVMDSSSGSYCLPETELMVPLEFWFNRHPGLALPLIALQYHEVRIKVTFAELGSLINTTIPAARTILAQKGLVSASLYAEYVYLDTEERRRFAQVAHEYLIEQLQFTGDQTFNTSTARVNLGDFNHPVKELVWVVQNPSYRDTCASATNCPWRYSDATGDSPVATALLQFNGHDRFEERTGKFFNRVQPYQHHGNSPSMGIHVYSFALHPEDHQPSGTCNFSRMDSSVLHLTLTDAAYVTAVIPLGATAPVTYGPTGEVSVRVYAVNYNVLRIMSGMGGLAYSN